MIARDGALTSLWQGNISPYVSTNAPDSSTVYDVIIVGGGITGISTALLLQEAGKRCLVIESENIGFGTTGGTTAHLNTLMDTPYYTIEKNFNADAAQLVADAAAAAISHIKQRNISCGFEEVNAYMFAEDEEQEKELDKIAESAAARGITIKQAGEIPVPIPFKKAVEIGGQAKFSPLEYVYGLAEAFEAAGGVILQHCRVTDAENGSPVKVSTAYGTFSGTDLVYATHIPPGINLLHLRCTPWRSYAMAVTLADENYPEGLVYDSQDPYHYYRTQQVNGRPYLIAGGKDHKTGLEENALQCTQALEAHVRKYFNVAEVNYTWSSQYFESADGLPYIGNLPGQQEHIYVATGFGGNGMIYSTISAMVLKDLITGVTSELAKLFDPNRIKPVAGFTSFMSHNKDVAKQLFHTMFPAEKIKTLAELAPDEGRLVQYEDHKLALYKDPQGQLYAVHSKCTHMKCDVHWNTAEKTWDCPCHGSRFSYDGKVVTGPADIDLDGAAL
jgi:glycine/D-amino acid oxidase-like deaminating enzyme/nitrite reductase/ring-hydroxylating ferredoxin subunit